MLLQCKSLSVQLLHNCYPLPSMSPFDPPAQVPLPSRCTAAPLRDADRAGAALHTVPRGLSMHNGEGKGIDL